MGKIILHIVQQILFVLVGQRHKRASGNLHLAAAPRHAAEVVDGGIHHIGAHQRGVVVVMLGQAVAQCAYIR